jgi:1-acyl-sn-glycerol-3-phosphate acyltransferase
MNNFFTTIYIYLQKHTILLYSLLVVIVMLMVYFALKVDFDEDVNSIFPDSKNMRTTSIAIRNIKVKDRIFILFSSKDTINPDPDRIITAGKMFSAGIEKSKARPLIKSIVAEVNDDAFNQTAKYIFDNLPILLTEKDYHELESMISQPAISEKMQSNYQKLVSPMGTWFKEIFLNDPIGLSNGAFASIQGFSDIASYNLYNGYIFSEDNSTMVIMIDPVNGTRNTGENEALIQVIEDEAKAITSEISDINIEPFGGPVIGVYNARQIKQDTMITLLIAILIIVFFISFAFRNKWAILQITAPVVFGALFALTMIYFISGSVSAIAIGAGAAVLGIAMSYSIHVISHLNHTTSVLQVIEELATPLTIGSFTTVGAFFGLQFTSSKLLQDFGLFAALSLVGTTLFCLIFLPHFLHVRKTEQSGILLQWIEKLNNYKFDKNKWIVGFILLVTIICGFKFSEVRFDSDIHHINYEPESLKNTEAKLSTVFKRKDDKVIFITFDSVTDSILTSYSSVFKQLEQLKQNGKVEKVISVLSLLIPVRVQKERIDQWNKFWTPEKKKKVLDLLAAEGLKYKFTKGAFVKFEEILSKNYSPKPVTIDELSTSFIFREWVSSAQGLNMALTLVSILPQNKSAVFEEFKDNPNTIIFHDGYFSQKLAISVRDDFNLILNISALLIFLALIISYGRIELALMTFIPMALSWIIILGMMAILNIEFNIVNVILSTFIFGIGDDFSIFIMDGLKHEYKTGKKMLASHKTAIFFSSFTTIVGMGALSFAKHPALKSVSVISVLGMITVVLISYTVQPVLFRIFISNPSRKGGIPQTISTISRTVYAYCVFVLGCLFLQVVILLLVLIPVKRNLKKSWFHALIFYAMRFILNAMFMIRKVYINNGQERFDKPSVIVANHQSFIDILVLLSLNKKLVMVTNKWVWNSPFFGPIVRYADFQLATDGYERLISSFKAKIEAGYSVIIFPEGTRSDDGKLGRFHKGAFYLAQQLNVDIVPIVLYGLGMAISKKQPFLVRKSSIVTKIMERISPNVNDYRVLAKSTRQLFALQYNLLLNEFSTPDNPYFFESILGNFTYKGPVLEWYLRIKIMMEHKYRFFDQIIPRDASIVDVGCGYGPLSYMLALTSSNRKVLGIDYDKTKIDVARHGALRPVNLAFEHGDAVMYDFSMADIFILNDMLHYLPEKEQNILFAQCSRCLKEGGMIIVRDGDTQKANRHRITQFTEILSTKIFGFNKAKTAFTFPSSNQMLNHARVYKMNLNQIENDIYTSNTIYIFSKK